MALRDENSTETWAQDTYLNKPPLQHHDYFLVDKKKMRVCAPLLPPPGDEVVCECLNEIERLREALTEIASGDRTAHECVNWAKLALR